MSLKFKSVLGAFCVAFAGFVEYMMWHSSVYWAILGVPGLVIASLIGGPHGGGSHLETVIANAASVIANSISYFWICLWIIRLRSRRSSLR